MRVRERDRSDNYYELTRDECGRIGLKLSDDAAAAALLAMADTPDTHDRPDTHEKTETDEISTPACGMRLLFYIMTIVQQPTCMHACMHARMHECCWLW